MQVAMVFAWVDALLLNDEDVVKVAAAAPDAKLFVTHLEGVNHNSVTREW